MRFSILIIGDEILLGRVTDTNSGTIARALIPQGWDAGTIRTVGDNSEDIRRAIEDLLAENDLVVTTGGLGPTRDDITKASMMEVFGGELKEDPDVLAMIDSIFAERGLKMNELTRSQALVPSSCKVIINNLGTAPIMWFEKNGKVLVAMPGVPFETRGMMPTVADEILKHFHPHRHVVRREYTVTGISESALAERLTSFEDDMPAGYKLAYLPSPGMIVLRLEGNPLTFDSQADRLVSLLDGILVGEGKLTPAESLLSQLRKRGLTLGTAESCTGGNIARLITEIPGCSDIFRGGVVAYSNEVKMNVLGVNTATLELYGAVSEQTVREMVEGTCRSLGCDCAVATSGIAGPGGGSAEKPVGTVWMAVKSPKGIIAEVRHFSGDRLAVIERASATAIRMLSEQLN